MDGRRQRALTALTICDEVPEYYIADKKGPDAGWPEERSG